MPLHNCPYCRCGYCASHKKSALTEQQKKAIIDICKRNKQDEEIGGLLLADGRVTQEVNHALDRLKAFEFLWNNKPAVGIWHRHLKSLDHAPKLSPSDIQAAHQAGLSIYMVYDVGNKKADYSSYLWDEYHRLGKPNRKPIRQYRIEFTCPTRQQLEQDIRESKQYIQEDNQRLKQAVIDANKELKAAQEQTIKELNKAALAMNSAAEEANILADKYRLVAGNKNHGMVQFSNRKQFSHGVIQQPETKNLQDPTRSSAIEGASQRVATNSEVYERRNRAGYQHFEFSERRSNRQPATDWRTR